MDLFDDDFEDELLDDEQLEDDGESPTKSSGRRQPAQQRSSADSSGEPEREAQFQDVFAFVEQLLAPVIQRKINTRAGGDLAWDPEWWHYPEVVVRLQALHRAWEAAYDSDDMSAMSQWWLHHCDPHMDRILNGSSGPFHKYNPDGASPIPPGLPVTLRPR